MAGVFHLEGSALPGKHIAEPLRERAGQFRIVADGIIANAEVAGSLADISAQWPVGGREVAPGFVDRLDDTVAVHNRDVGGQGIQSRLGKAA
jgi:hypothetical protein